MVHTLMILSLCCHDCIKPNCVPFVVRERPPRTGSDLLVSAVAFVAALP